MSKRGSCGGSGEGTSLVTHDPTIWQEVLGYMVTVAIIERPDIKINK